MIADYWPEYFGEPKPMSRPETYHFALWEREVAELAHLVDLFVDEP